MQFNWPIVLLAAIIPLIVGFIWYHPKVFGTVWMNVNGFTPESKKGANMAKIFGWTFFFSIMLALSIHFIVIHQYHVYSIFASDTTTESKDYLTAFMEKYGKNFRTFKHGVLHGIISGVFFVFPIIAINSLFERRGFKYAFIHAGFWIVSIALMGGIICAYAY
jgi:uncharacterized membrane protein YqhA